MSRPLLCPTMILASTALVALLWLAGIDGPLRAFVAFWFMLTCPGLAIVGLFGIRDMTTRIVASVALSLSIDCLVAMAMVYRVGWSPAGGFMVLAVTCIVGAGLQIRQQRTSTPTVVEHA